MNLFSVDLLCQVCILTCLGHFYFVENRLSEMARMGIGNKPCLDIKPSKDNINDRFVNIHNRSEYLTQHGI